jgi:hypothetical protein
MPRITFNRSRRRILAAGVCALMLAAPASAGALDVQVKDVRAAASAVRTAVELRNIVPERFRKLIEDGSVLHLRVQAELWESRPVWDRLVYPAIVKVFRLGRTTSGRDVAITDPAGAITRYATLPNLLAVLVDLGEANRVAESQKYYVHVVATLGTLAERDVDEVGDAVFGREGEANGLGSLGRMVVRTAMKVSDYLQSVSAEARSRRIDGRDIIHP